MLNTSTVPQSAAIDIRTIEAPSASSPLNIGISSTQTGNHSTQSSTTRLPHEQRFLGTNARWAETPIVLVAGESNALSTGMNVLEQAKLASVLPTRITPDRYQHPAAPTSLVTPDQPKSSLAKVMFSFRDGSGSLHGATLYDLIRGLQSSPRDGIVINVGGPENILPVTEAIRTHLPLCPIASMVLLPDQSNTRDQVELRKTYSRAQTLETILHAKSVIIKGETPEQDREMTTEELRAVILAAREQAIAERERQAAFLRSSIKLTNDSGHIPEAVMQVLDGRLIPEAREMGREIVLKGGCALAAMLNGTSRQISHDVDFTAYIGHEEFEALVELTTRFAGAEVAIQARPSNQYSPRSTKISGLYKGENGTSIELDAVPVRRVVRKDDNDATTVVFEFKYDAIGHAHRRKVELPSGQSVSVVPPELALVEKLTAARGIEHGKFDLYDAAGILSTFELDPLIVSRYIHRQRYKPELDSLILCRDLRFDELAERLDDIGVESEAVKSLVVQEVEQQIRSGSIDSSSVHTFLTATRLKQIVLADALLSGAEQIRGHIENDHALPQQYRVKTRWGEEKLRQGLTRFEQLVLLALETDTLSPNNYVRRTPKSSSQTDYFINASLPRATAVTS